MNTDNKSYEYIVRVEFPKVFEAIEKFLKPQNRGFELVYSGIVPNSLPSILYQSNQCKIRIQCNRDRPYEEIEIYIRYGRLHAPLDKDIIMWKDEKRYCWHSLESSPILNFLDGLSPVDVDNKEFIFPRVMKFFGEANKNMNWMRPEHFARKHAFIWEYYGERLFNLFDLRHADLWKEYTDFLEEYCKRNDEKIKKEKLFLVPFDPPRYKVC